MIDFTTLNWQSDRLLLNDLTFRLQHQKSDEWNGDANHFIFYKDKKLLDQYQTFFDTQGVGFSPKKVIEIGMWDGGSAVFWNEILKPDRMVGLDILETGGGDYFKKYKSDTLKTYWSTDQSDATKLRAIFDENFGETPVDVIFDDASHMYWPTLISFNTLFPRLKPGGLYFIEDWAWGHWKGFENTFGPGHEPTKLIFELVEACANLGLIESVNVYSGFVVVKRSTKPFDGLINDYNLKKDIYRRPVSLKNRLKKAIKIVLEKN